MSEDKKTSVPEAGGPSRIILTVDDLAGIMQRKSRLLDAYLANTAPEVYAGELIYNHVADMHALAERMRAAIELRSSMAKKANGHDPSSAH